MQTFFISVINYILLKHSLSKANNTESVFEIIVAALGALYLYSYT
jgi:hypothetical protein